jgi:glycosyltransferase involved in cell wall biosynthesis
VKITIVQGAFLPVPPLLGGAVEKWWYHLGKEFARRGHSVTHVSRKFRNLPSNETIQDVNHIRVCGFKAPKSLVWLKALDLIYSLRVTRILSDADILVSNTFWLPIVCRRSRAGLIYVHVARFPKGQMRFYGRAARLQAVSNVVRDAIIEQAPGMKSKACVKPGLLSEEMLAERSPRENSTRQICYVGRIHPEKGLELLMAAFALLVEQGLKNWKLRVIGPWEISQGGAGRDFLARLKQVAKGCGDQVEFLGPEFNQASLSRHFQESDLFVYPSLAATGEAFPSAPLEAMASYCPALVSNLACFRDYISDGENGFVFNHLEPHNSLVLARKLGSLLEKPQLLLSAGKRARITAEQFSCERVAGQYLEDFQQLVETQGMEMPVLKTV